MWRDLDHDPRSRERDRPDLSRHGRPEGGSSDRPVTAPRDVFARDLELPRGADRERVHVHAHTYDLRGADVRALATVGAFRVVPEGDLRGPDSRPRDLRRLQELGLVRAQPYVVGKSRTNLVSLTDRGRDLLEHGRQGSRESNGQTFYAGISKPRELAHDAHVYRAYLRGADQLVGRGAHVRRVVLEEELKREYQRFLQASNRQRRDSDGRPDRSAGE